MSVSELRREVVDQVIVYGDVLEPPAANHVFARVEEPPNLLHLVAALAQRDFYLVTMVANDERELEDNCFKLYITLSHPRGDLFLTVEYLLSGETYPSLYPHYPAVDPFEREIRDLFGLCPDGERGRHVPRGSWLHSPYPPDVFPLRRDLTTAEIKQRIAAYNRQGVRPTTPLDTMRPGHGHLFFPVGPVHAGIIEPGWFVFEVGGEVIEDLHIFLGYTHKGIERLFQSRMTLLDGWTLAEQVSGDASFAHSLAYCHAVEALAGTDPPEAAHLLRGLFLEMERIYNHVGDVAALAHDVALDVIASELGVIREELLRLNAAVAGHRLLRGINRPGGVVLPWPLEADRIRSTFASCLERYRELTRALAYASHFRGRTVDTGILTLEDARRVGATGLVARASGIARDYRRDHPWGVYRTAWAQECLSRYPEEDAGLVEEARRGDVHARFLTRVLEVDTSAAVIEAILQHWERLPEHRETHFCEAVRFAPERDYNFALGYAESWRGDVVYWLMQDKLQRIYRCKVRDPSMLNWPAMRLAIIPHEVNGHQVETILPDFPVINKSFNLSYSGNDL